MCSALKFLQVVLLAMPLLVDCFHCASSRPQRHSYWYSPLSHERISIKNDSKYQLSSGDSRIRYAPEERYYKMITDKQSEIDALIRDHSDPSDKLQLRLNFLQCTSNHKLSEMICRNSSSKSHKLSAIADMKRRTPTHNPKCDNTILSYVDAAEVALNMANTGFDVIFVNTDEASYGGHVKELHRCFLELRKLGRRQRPALVMKDIFLHPIQIAQAAEYRADGVVLNAAILGSSLIDMLTSCITMGLEAIVEVHTVADALRSVEAGANLIMINQWDRVENKLYPTRALEVKLALPEEVRVIASGGIISMEQVHELALAGFDAVCFGRRLIYPDVPDFIASVKNWRGPSKGILRMSQPLFFNLDQTPDGLITPTLKENHKKLLNEMNSFYLGRDNEVEFVESFIPPPASTPPDPEKYKQDKLFGEGTQVHTITIGTPVSEENMIPVGTLAVSPEGQKEYVDPNKYYVEQRDEFYQEKWFIEKQRWILKNHSKYSTKDEAACAYDLKKAIEMYNHFVHEVKPELINVMPAEKMESAIQALLSNIKKCYEKAPKIDGKPILEFD